MGAWVDYLSNGSPPIATYRAFMNGLLLAGNKQPGVRQINCGEIFCCYWGKVVMQITGFQAKEECGSIELCAGIAAGLDGAIHAVRQSLGAEDWDLTETQPTHTEDEDEESEEDGSVRTEEETTGSNDADLGTQPAVAETTEDDEEEMEADYEAEEEEETVAAPPNEWDADPQDPDPLSIGALLVDAKTGFQNLGRLSALWTFRHIWPRACRFIFNMYRHQALCIVRSKATAPIIIRSKEGIGQGCPMSMGIYGIAMVPLGRMLQEAER